MGAQRSNEEDLDEFDIVVDISRDSRVRGAPLRAGQKVAAMDETSDSEPSQRRSSSSDTSEGTQGRGEDANREEMEEEGSVRESSVKAAADVALKLKPHRVEAVDEEALPSKNGSEREGGILNGAGPQESDSPVKQKSRKRKKTIHFRNSRVPHAIPTLESESEEESGSPERNEEAEALPVRHAPGPRSAASKV